MKDRSMMGFVLGAAGALALVAAPAAVAAPPAPKAKACCEGHAGTAAHDHSKCPMHSADKDHSKCAMHGGTAADASAAGKDATAAKCPYAARHARTDGARGAGAPAKEAKAKFACPMHPEVSSDAKDRCPKCGMFLEQKR